MAIVQITAGQACSRCAPELLSFETTNEITQFEGFAGQDRAIKAVAFGVDMHHQGFNLYISGHQGTGRHEVTLSLVREKAAQEPAPSDWCYVNNFIHSHKPKVFDFPSGKGAIFKKEIDDLIDVLKTTIPAVIEDDGFQEKIKVVNAESQKRIDKLLNNLEEKANTDSIALIKSDRGMLFIPVDSNKKQIDQASFQRLPAEAQKRLEQLLAKYQQQLQDILGQIAILKRDAEELRRKLKIDTVGQAIAYMINTLKKKYENRPEVKEYLQEVEDDIIIHADDFLYKSDEDRNTLIQILHTPSPTFERYAVNILVDNHAAGAPVIYEDLPTYQNLHGRIEHIARMGVLTTHFTLIKPGSLHRANGGYILIDAHRLLMQPYAYEGLKRSLRSGKIRIEPIERLLGLMSTVSLEPEPIPLQTKVILIGDTLVYYLLKYYDPEFQSFFKVQADFEQSMDLSPENIKLYTSLIATIINKEGLLPMQRNGVARIIEYGARDAGDGAKLSLAVEKLADVMKEADFMARKQEKTRITKEDVETALEARKQRGGRIRDRMFEAIERGLRHIETAGERIGQVNGLSIIALVDDVFGIPTRLTALTRSGKGEIIDIEKEVELGGAVHSKGVLILDSFLSSRYVRDMPLSLRASLVFEQSYGDVEGDSASCAELCALLSSLANMPIQQSLAITGAVSQHGEVQAIGGVNEKIEGFFDLCFVRGLSGREGVIIPEANVMHLMLKNEVVEAITAKKFHIWSVTTVDEAISLLTSYPAGERGTDGEYPEESINGKVEATLRSFALSIQMFEKLKINEKPSSPSPSSEESDLGKKLKIT